jgi:hypothetical protein
VYAINAVSVVVAIACHCLLLLLLVQALRCAQLVLMRLLLLPLNTLWLLLLLLYTVPFLFTAGDIMTVNGKPWPYHKVEKRTYRFNLVNAGVYSSPLQNSGSIVLCSAV